MALEGMQIWRMKPRGKHGLIRWNVYPMKSIYKDTNEIVRTTIKRENLLIDIIPEFRDS